jgi:hypothetical protein
MRMEYWSNGMVEYWVTRFKEFHHEGHEAHEAHEVRKLF